ncbi:uncharacterized protein [Haliotis asinina]|uniref:uncharacterized protein n=1 Tax=Haliotis asinina TaxID=109174 RepID=UPI003531AB00
MSAPSSIPGPQILLNVSDLLLPPINYTDVTDLAPSANVSSLVQEGDRVNTYTDSRPPREFPLALVIASPVVAVFILVFFCVSYYWHASYLDRQARKLAIRMAADAESGLRPSRRTRRGLGTDGRKGRSRRLSSPTPSVPKRVSSAVTDQEILSHFAARRHSTFFI